MDRPIDVQRIGRLIRRVARSMIATEPRMPAAAINLPSRESASAMIGVCTASISPVSAPAPERK